MRHIEPCRAFSKMKSSAKMFAFMCLAMAMVQGAQPRIMRNDIPPRCIQNSITPVNCTEPLPEDRLLPHPDDCELFYYCVTADLPPICRQCPAELHFSPVKRVCDRPEEAGCKANSNRNIVPNNDISQRCIDSSVTEVECPDPLPQDNLLPHPDMCELFYYCVLPGMKPICRDCPANLHFNPIKRVCDQPEDAGCKLKRTEHSLTAPH